MEGITPEKGRKMVAEFTLFYPVIKAPTLVFIGVPGVGKSTIVRDGFTTAVFALASALVDTLPFDEDLKTLIKVNVFGERARHNALTSYVTLLIEREKPFKKFLTNVGYSLYVLDYIEGKLSQDQLYELSGSAYAKRGEDFLYSFKEALRHTLEGNTPLSELYNTLEGKVDPLILDTIRRLLEASHKCSNDALCVSLKAKIIKMLRSDDEAFKSEMYKKLVYVFRGAIKASMIGKFFNDYVDSIVVEYNGNASFLALYENAIVYNNVVLSMHTIETLLGIPTFKAIKGDAMVISPPMWALATREASLGAVNLDEVTNVMPPEKQTALYAITLEGRVGEVFLGKPIFGTGNNAESSALVGTLPGPLVTGRMVFVPMRPPSVEEWIDYMNRKHKDKWFKPWGEFLKHVTSMSKELFIASEAKIRSKSEVEPSINEPMGYPTPRVHEKIATFLYRLYVELKHGLTNYEDASSEARLFVYSSTGSEILADASKAMFTSEAILTLIRLKQEDVLSVNTFRMIKQSMLRVVNDVLNAFMNAGKGEEYLRALASSYATLFVWKFLVDSLVNSASEREVSDEEVEKAKEEVKRMITNAKDRMKEKVDTVRFLDLTWDVIKGVLISIERLELSDEEERERKIRKKKKF